MPGKYSHVFGRLGPAVLLCVIVGLTSYPEAASAHEIHVTAHVHDGAIHGEARYPDDTPVGGAKVTAFDPAGEQIGRTTTDEQGEFSLEAKFRCDHRLLVDTGDGHGAEYTVRATLLPANLPPRGDAPASGLPVGESASLQAVVHELVHLGERLDRYERKVWLRDVLGGIGYILGIGGVAFFFLGARRQQPKRKDR